MVGALFVKVEVQGLCLARTGIPGALFGEDRGEKGLCLAE